MSDVLESLDKSEPDDEEADLEPTASLPSDESEESEESESSEEEEDEDEEEEDDEF